MPPKSQGEYTLRDLERKVKELRNFADDAETQIKRAKVDFGLEDDQQLTIEGETGIANAWIALGNWAANIGRAVSNAAASVK